MQRQTPMALIAAVLVACSVVLYGAHYLLFGDAHHIFLYLVGDLAFLPIEVLLVVIVMERLLSARDKVAMLRKLNMVIGAFFSEVGTQLLGELTPAVQEKEQVRRELAVTNEWRPRDFQRAVGFARSFAYEMNPRLLNLEELRQLLVTKREFMVRLLENPNLLEHDRFTDLLWAVFHLAEELTARSALDELPERDLEHLAGDMQRAYSQLAAEWVIYVQHLQMDYPYLFSLMIRTHPLQEHPSALVR